MSNDPLALVTVTLPRPITSSELMAAVKALSDSGDSYYGTSFEVSQRFDNGDVFMIGQFSKYPYNQLLVAPSREQREIRPGETHEQVDVMSHAWPGSYFPVGYEDSAVTNAVRRFAKKLEEHFANPSSRPTDSSVWPQEVTVCALCERIVTRHFENVVCPQDGNNPPTRTIKVTPIAG